MKALSRFFIITFFLYWQSMVRADYSFVTVKPIEVDFHQCSEGEINNLQYKAGYNVGGLFISEYWNRMGGAFLSKCKRFEEIKNHIYQLNEAYLNPEDSPTVQYVCRMEGQVRGAVAKAWSLGERCHEKVTQDVVSYGVRLGVDNADIFCGSEITPLQDKWEQAGPVKGKGKVTIPEFPDVTSTYNRYIGLGCRAAFVARVNEKCPSMAEGDLTDYNQFLEQCELQP